MGVKLTIPGAVFTGPKRYDHPLLTAGSLALFDPQHPLGEFDGIPAHLTKIPNVAAGILAGITGQSGDALLSIFANNADGAAPPPSIKERSGLGGLYALYSHANPNTDVGTSYLGVMAPDAVRQHVYNNPTHQYFAAGWFNVVRKGRYGPSGAAAQAIFIGTVNPVSSTANYMDMQNGGSTGGANQIGARTAGGVHTSDVIVKEFNIDRAWSGWNGSVPGHGLGWGGQSGSLGTGALGTVTPSRGRRVSFRWAIWKT